MYFCPNCSYLFDISKSSTGSTEIDSRKELTKIAEVFKKLDDNEDLSNYKASFSKDDLTKNKRYQKLKDESKIKINEIFNEIVTSGAEFKCDNCNFIKPIIETTLLYQINNDVKIIKNKKLEENELICKDPLFPHTQNYTCKNPNCSTHKNPLTKDSVFYKERNSYKLTYICCVCYYNW